MANNINANQRIDAISVSGKIHTIAPFHGTAAEWENNLLYIPSQGEIVIYDIDDNNDKSKFKIGDGETTVANLPFFTCDNGGDEKVMYGVDANKDGNVELIFGAKPLINFTIEDRYGGTSFAFETLNCQAEEGMTWENWLNSKYNNIPSSDQVNSWPDAGVVINGYNIYNSDLFTVNPSDVIINNSEYYVTA